ncbi:MAG: Endoglycoceramidase [bacterium]|nr:Endoglycoceramidase [bacterium]
MRALLALTLVVAGCGNSPSGWHVAGDFLRAPDGRAAILRGVNLSGAQKSAPYLDDKELADYQRIRADWGMNAIRFVMTWAAVEPDLGRYDDAYLDGVAARLGWAQQSGLAVVLELHEDVYGEGFGFDGAPRWTCDSARYAAFTPRTPWFVNTLDPNVIACVDDFYTRADLQQHFVAAWRHVAERLGREPAVIGFDVLNEPEWGSYSIFDFEHDRLTPLYDKVVATVRAAAPGWVAFLEPSSSRNAGIASGLTAFEFSNVMYAPHSYDQSAEGGGGFDPAHRQQILDNVDKLAGEAHALHAGLWIGEYGGVATAPGIVEYMTAQYDAAGRVAGSTMYWAYDKSDGYALLNPDGSEKTTLLDTLVRPYPERVAGDPISYAFDAATSTFTLAYAPDASAKLPTEIVVPDRAYPNGYQVECGGCQYEKRSGALSIESPPGTGPATVIIRP